ncbi:MAG TPA: hypothetical protein VFI33_10770 [Puia sp.]|nr:hypothetical protein [Puia sp.]
MKQILFFSFLFIFTNSFAQTPFNGDTVNFCFIKYKVPEGCKATSEYQVKCDQYSMTWIYLTPQIFQTMPDQVINQMAGQMKKFKKEPVTCYLLGNPVKGYKISYKTDEGTGHQLIASGMANEQLVLVQLSLDREPKTDDDIPAFPRQIIRLSK